MGGNGERWNYPPLSVGLDVGAQRPGLISDMSVGNLRPALWTRPYLFLVPTETEHLEWAW